MKFIDLSKLLLASATLVLFSVLPNAAMAGPGAHGPNGEHIDAPSSTSGKASMSPRFEVQSESYEIVGSLLKGELSMLIDRFETNVPVRQATVQVELGQLKAEAKYHDDLGDFSIDDETILKELWKQGTHALVISIIEDEDSDLIDVKLVVGDQADAHSHFEYKYAIVLVAGLLIALLAFVAFKKRHLFTKFRQGGL